MATLRKDIITFLIAYAILTSLLNISYFLYNIDVRIQFSYNHLYKPSEIKQHLLPLPGAKYNESNLNLKFLKQRYKNNKLLTSYESFPSYELNQTHIYNKYIIQKKGKGIVYSVFNQHSLIQVYVSISMFNKINSTNCAIQIFNENEHLYQLCNDLFSDISKVTCMLVDNEMLNFVSSNFYSEKETDHRLWSSKYIVMIQSSFEDILFLDCDNIIIRDPNYLFNSTYYKLYRAIFWPDFSFGPNNWCESNLTFFVNKTNTIWNKYNLSSSYDMNDIRYKYSIESGQILINSKLYHNELLFALSNNDRFDIRSIIYGDKDFWRITFLLFNTSFLTVPYLPINLMGLSTDLRGKTHMGQFWFDHKLLFIHGNKLLNCYSSNFFFADKSYYYIRNNIFCDERKEFMKWIPRVFAANTIISYLYGYRFGYLYHNHFYLNHKSIVFDDLNYFESQSRKYYIIACERMNINNNQICKCADPFYRYWIVNILIFILLLILLYGIIKLIKTFINFAIKIKKKSWIPFRLRRHHRNID